MEETIATILAWLGWNTAETTDTDELQESDAMPDTTEGNAEDDRAKPQSSHYDVVGVVKSKDRLDRTTGFVIKTKKTRANYRYVAVHPQRLRYSEIVYIVVLLDLNAESGY